MKKLLSLFLLTLIVGSLMAQIQVRKIKPLGSEPIKEEKKIN